MRGLGTRVGWLRCGGLALAAVAALACGDEGRPAAAAATSEPERGAAATAAAGEVAPAEPGKPRPMGPQPERGAQFKSRPGAEFLRQRLQQRDIQNFAFVWAVSPDGLFANKWLGVPTIQNPLDVWVTQEIMWEVKPDFIVEAGTLKGGSAALWATILEQINPKGRVITIDILDQMTDARELPIVQRKVDFLLGSSTDPEIVDEVRRRTAGGSVLVILDSLHTQEHVAAELAAYGPMVTPGSYVIVQDTGIPLVPPGQGSQGVGRAAEAYAAAHDEFVIDHSRERWVLTNNGNGFLKRVR